jgi:hypothetical protein
VKNGRLIIYGTIIALAPLVLVTSIVCDRYSFGFVTRQSRLVGICVVSHENRATAHLFTLSTNGTIKYQQQTPLFLRVGPRSEDQSPSPPTNTWLQPVSP